MPDTSPSTQPGVPPGNVYNREQRRGNQRTRTRHLESGAPLTRQPRDREDNPARQTFLASVRRFAAVSAIMGVVLFITIKGLALMDRRYEARFIVPPENTQALANEVLPAESTTAADKAVTNVATETSEPSSSEDTMRQAAFLARRGKNLEAEGRYKDAIDRYRESLELWPYQPQMWAQIGRLHMKVGDFARAQTALERAAGDNPSATELLNDLGVAYFQQGNIASAIKSFTAYSEFDPASAPAYFNLSLCYLAKGDTLQARRFLDRFLALEPNDPRALRQAAFMDAATNNLDAARTALEKALAQDPDWPLLYLDAAAVEAKSTNATKALEYLRQATERISPTLVQRIYANTVFNQVRTTPEARIFEQDLAARVARTDVSVTGEAVVAESPAPISSVTETR
jgi:tetratricopeptide (TPR) repeat protein